MDTTPQGLAASADSSDSFLIPTVSFECDELFHVGTLNPADKAASYRQSYEGSGLSVSRHPDDWRGVARLGGPTWQCSRDGNSFVDMWALTPANCDAVTSWAVAHGLLEPVTRYQVTYFDEEWEREVTFHVHTRQQALDEIGSAPAGDDTMTEITALAITPKLAVLQGGTDGDTSMAFDHALVQWTSATTNHDGVWWEDEWDPVRLSLPRGTIFAHRLHLWQITKAA